MPLLASIFWSALCWCFFNTFPFIHLLQYPQLSCEKENTAKWSYSCCMFNFTIFMILTALQFQLSHKPRLYSHTHVHQLPVWSPSPVSQNLFNEEILKISSPWIRESLRGTQHSIPIFTGQLERGQRLYLHKTYMEKTRDDGYKLYQERFHLSIRKIFLTVRTNIPWNSFPGDMADFPSLEVFKM